jgi:hypothetical protein
MQSPLPIVSESRPREGDRLLLGRRILALYGQGRLPSAIADTLGKNEPVVRGYLREAEAAGLLAESA